MKDLTLSRRSLFAASAATAGILAAANAGLGKVDFAKAEGGTITATCAYSSTNYSPIGCSSALMLGATWHVFEGLYELDLHDYTTYPALAAGEPEKVSDTEYKVTLRDGAKYSDGTDVVAADVVNAFELNMANDTYSAFLSFIDSVSAVDDKTVDFVLKFPFESLLQGRLAVVKIFPASISADDMNVSPIGSGPWAYSNLNGDDGGSIDFVPNEYYNGPKPATADAMHWDIQKDGTARTTAIMAQTSMVMEAVPDANVDAIQGAGATVEYKDGFSLPFLMFNTKKAPFDDKRVRQAFFYAIDVQKLIDNIMAGHANLVKSFLPENFANFHEASNVYTYDPEKAKSLLSEAGYADGIDVELLCNNNWVADLSIQIQNDLNAAGINTTLRTEAINWAELAADMAHVRSGSTGQYHHCLSNLLIGHAKHHELEHLFLTHGKVVGPRHSRAAPGHVLTRGHDEHNRRRRVARIIRGIRKAMPPPNGSLWNKSKNASNFKIVKKQRAHKHQDSSNARRKELQGHTPCRKRLHKKIADKIAKKMPDMLHRQQRAQSTDGIEFMPLAHHDKRDEHKQIECG